MPGVSQNATQMTRRDFLKTSAVVAGGAWLGSNLGLAPEGALAEEAQQGERVFVNGCRPNCFNACMLNVHVREGKVVKTSPADFPNKEFNRVCLRGLAHVTNMYSPARLQYPLKRVEGTERGAGQWERVTWEEALTDIAEKFRQVGAIEKHHEERYRKLIGNIEGGLVFSRDGDRTWICSNCGHIVIGREAPEMCPVCAHPQSYFELRAENY